MGFMPCSKKNGQFIALAADNPLVHGLLRIARKRRSALRSDHAAQGRGAGDGCPAQPRARQANKLLCSGFLGGARRSSALQIRPRQFFLGGGIHPQHVHQIGLHATEVLVHPVQRRVQELFLHAHSTASTSSRAWRPI